MENEKRLIDANALKQCAADMATFEPRMKKALAFVNSLIDMSLAVDAVEVVRCKDCIYNKTGSCSFSKYVDPTNYQPNWFCADGERKDNEV